MKYESNDLDGALKVYEEGLAVERAVLDAAHPNIVVTLTNVSQIYKLKGDFHKALRFYQQAIAIQKQNLEEDHPSIAASLSSIALLHYQTRNYTKALEPR
jgi:tetratricopeptide (TPR) repeat protein